MTRTTIRRDRFTPSMKARDAAFGVAIFPAQAWLWVCCKVFRVRFNGEWNVKE